MGFHVEATGVICGPPIQRREQESSQRSVDVARNQRSPEPVCVFPDKNSKMFRTLVAFGQSFQCRQEFLREP